MRDNAGKVDRCQIMESLVCHTEECGLRPGGIWDWFVLANRSSMITYSSGEIAVGSRMEGGKSEVERTKTVKCSKGEARRTNPAVARGVENLVLSERN